MAGYPGEHLYVVTILNAQGLGYVVLGVLALMLLKRHYGSPTPTAATVQTTELQTENL